MVFIDSHCHLDFETLQLNFEQVLTRAQQNNVTHYVVPSVSADHFNALLSLSAQHTAIHLALGLHPCFMAQHTEQDLALLEQLVAKYSPCAVGEIGLDFFIEADPSRQAQQLSLFKAQIKIAQQAAIPVILHVRKAHDQVLQVLKQLKFCAGGIIHAFNGSAVQAQRYTQEFGFKLGFGGAITHPRATKLRALAASLALSDIVLETDAPDMPLYAMPNAFNEPANIKYIAQTLSELRPESLAEIAAQTFSNTVNCLALVDAIHA